ncbi:MAG TPA: hypothetical protein VFA56_01765 [Gaiellaceae bacterium]|nr:hypothetical protein [Gaiellaceae bacterium]
MRRGVGALVAVLCAAAASSAAAVASPGAQFGIQDDAWLMYGPGTLDARVLTIRGLGAGLVRFTLRWDQVAPSRPARPRDPGDSAYRWGVYGDVLDALHASGVPVLLTLYGAPRWANAGGGPNVLPDTGMGDFAYAAAARFPWVRLWTVWNEPNSRTFSSPVSPSRYVRDVLNPAYASLHEASSANRVAGGVTSPRKTPTGMAPLAYMRGMRAAHARLDAYAQNPYPVSRVETPYAGRCSDCFTLASLAVMRRDVTRMFGPKPLWLTEYGYQTNPPDSLLGVSYAQQATYLGEAALKVWRQAGVTMLIQFLVRDEPAVGAWQSGLFDVRGVPKPAYHAFALPLAQSGRSGARVTLWGQVRPGAGARAYRLERAVGSTWRTVGGTRRTSGTGTFTATIAAPRGARVRVVAPALGWAGPPLTLR